MKSAMMAKPSTKGLVSGSSKVKVSLNGRVSAAIRFASSEAESSLQAIDNSHSGSRFGVKASGALDKEFSATSTIEVGVNGPARWATGYEPSTQAAIGLRIAQVAITHKDMGTLSIGQSWLAGSGGFGANFVGTGHVFGIWGPGGDGIMATADGAAVGARHGTGSFRAFGTRKARIQYNTPNLMGVGLEASYNHDKGWSAGASFSGFPNMKEVSVALNGAYHSVGEDGDMIGYGVSGSVKHNASGVIATGMYGEQETAAADLTAWMIEAGWTGKVTKAGNTSLTIGYGVWGDGISESTRYHFALNQNVEATGTDLYVGASHDSGEATDDSGAAVERDGVFTVISGILLKF